MSKNHTTSADSKEDKGDQETHQIRGPWETPVIRDDDGNVVGATFFLDSEVIQTLNIDVEYHDKLHYSITNEDKIEITEPE